MKNIIQNILNYSTLQNQISILCMNKYTSNNIHIKKLSSNKINQSTILQKKFSKLIILDLYDNKYVNDVNHLCDTLIGLNCGGYINGVAQCGLIKLNKLRYLNIYDNSKVNCLKNFVDTLEGLNCGGGLSAITQNDLINFTRLKFLNIYCNDKIIDVNHMNSHLIGLNCGSFYAGRMKIEQKGMQKLRRLELLFSENNHNIHVKNINDIITDNRCYRHGDFFGIDILDTYISNSIIFRERFDKIKTQVYEKFSQNSI